LGVYQEEAFVAENYRMGELAGAVARAQLRKLDSIVDTLRASHKRIKEAISDIREFEFRRIPDEQGHVGFTLVFFLPTRDQAVHFIKALVAENIGAYQLYGGDPVYAYPQILNQRTLTTDGCPFRCPLADNKVRYQMGMCPRAEDLLGRSVWIPISTLLTPDDIEDIITAIRKVHRRLAY
jgi:8-amino-3,8-dideoxy-alpha-D-manno-octulosonate transaminase